MAPLAVPFLHRPYPPAHTVLALSTLLALRFVSVCFEEVRALAVGLAVRGIRWDRAGGALSRYL